MQASGNKLLGRQQIVRLLLETLVIVFSVLFALAVNGCREKAQMRQTVDRIHETLRREVTQNQEAVEASLAHHEQLLTELQHGWRLLQRLPWDKLDLSAEDLDTADEVARFLQPFAAATGNESAPIEVEPASDEADLEHGVQFVARVEDIVIKVRLTEEAVEILGTGNISLGPAYLRNTAWDTLQVSGAALALDYELLEQASNLHQLQDWYRDTVSKTIDLLYSGNLMATKLRPMGFLPTLKDLTAQERTLLREYDVALKMLDEKG